MKVLTAAQMREVDRRTIEMGVPGAVLMENAGSRVVEFLEERFSPLGDQRIVVFCGKGNNGGDGLVVARQLFERYRPQVLSVVLVAAPEEMKGAAADHYRRLIETGCPVLRELAPDPQGVTLVIDALLGTGLSGPAKGEMLDSIRRINSGFARAKIVAVDIPSGLASDTGRTQGECVHADYTVSFTAPKVDRCCRRIASMSASCACAPSAAPRSYSRKTTAFFSRWSSPRSSATCSRRDHRRRTKAASGMC